jgi:hypothetical protein
VCSRRVEVIRRQQQEGEQRWVTKGSTMMNDAADRNRKRFECVGTKSEEVLRRQQRIEEASQCLTGSFI